MKKWIFFDVMGVIFMVGDDTKDLLVPFIKEKNNKKTIEEINNAYMDASLGKINSLSFWKSMNIEGNHIEIEHEYLDSKLILDEQIISVFKELYQKYNIALLSNDVSEWSNYLREKYGLDEFLKQVVISGDVKCRKPSKDIYEIALQKANCSAEDCIFIDDRMKNLYPASDLGMKVIKYNREDNFDINLTLPQANAINEIPEIVEQIFYER
ncbi:MAG TPA: HAD family hydrolase [Candidatus Paceibacterota bacterium]